MNSRFCHLARDTLDLHLVILFCHLIIYSSMYLWIYLLETSLTVQSKNSTTSFIDSFLWSLAWHFRLSTVLTGLFCQCFVMWVATHHVRVTLISSSFCSLKWAFLRNVSFRCVLTVVKLAEIFGLSLRFRDLEGILGLRFRDLEGILGLRFRDLEGILGLRQTELWFQQRLFLYT